MTESTTAAPGKIILVGNDERLVYLLQRYFEQSAFQLIPWLTIPSAAEIKRVNPTMLIFSTIELLEMAQSLLDHTSTHEIPVLVCTSLACEAHARELGADACLLHPLSYECFRITMAGVFPMESKLSGF